MRTRLVKIVSADTITPLSLATKLHARVILESSSYQKGRSRYSLLLIDEAFSVFQKGENMYLSFPKGRRVKRIKSASRDILDLLKYFADQHQSMHQDFPLPAGGVGFCSYEFATFCDTINMSPKPDELSLPDAIFIIGHTFVVFDHYTDQLYLIALNYRESQVNLEALISSLERRIWATDINYPQTESIVYNFEEISAADHESHYKEMVEFLRKEIIAGNLLQAVPSRRRRFRTKMPAITAYRKLRQKNPSPYLFYLDFGTWQLFGASPEVHVRVKDGRATIRPIAGTRRRGIDAAEDMALENELLTDEKELAEHLMLIDLARNDLGRVCIPRTVKVIERMTIERYSRVMHIVSQVEGDLDQAQSGIDALRATFPAGTVSGAPKIRAIETIHELETMQRRFYAGVVGYIEPGGDLDTCISIRSALYKDGVLTLQAGGGVVYDSKPDRELEETNEKMSALLNALGLLEDNSDPYY